MMPIFRSLNLLRQRAKPIHNGRVVQFTLARPLFLLVPVQRLEFLSRKWVVNGS